MSAFGFGRSCVAIADAMCTRKAVNQVHGSQKVALPLVRRKVAQGAADKIFLRKHANSALGRREAAVEAVVTIVPHQEEMARRHPDWTKIVGRPLVQLVERGVARSSRKALQIGAVNTVENE